jgi:hypothetical protein
MIFGVGNVKEFQQLKFILDLFFSTTDMQINVTNSTMLICVIKEDMLLQLDELLPLNHRRIEEGIKYLGFKLKPRSYSLDDWMWLAKKNQERISLWDFCLLYRGGFLVLINSLLGSIFVYWAYIDNIPKGVLTRIKKICFQFLWLGKRDVAGIPLVKWS